MIPYEEALTMLLKAGAGKKLETESLAPGQCVGRVCAKEVSSPHDNQPFDNSAMDGYAVRLEDIKGSDSVLECAGIIAAGDPVPQEAMKPGTCLQIMTGAPLPPGAQTVVPVEEVKIEGRKVIFPALPKPDAHIRKAGEDFKAGDRVLSAGQRILPQHVMPLAALGIGQIEVYKKPRVAFLSTGRELVNDPAQNLKPGQIYNSNLPYSVAMLETMGADCVFRQTIPDDPGQFTFTLKKLVEKRTDIIISSGAVSAGAFDFVREALEKLGAGILFHKVKIKPGKPNLLACLPGGALYFGLPGNPVATAAGLRFFVEPALRAMMGMEDEKPLCAVAASSFRKRAGLQIFLKACAKSGRDGKLNVRFLEGQESFMVKPLLFMNGWAVVPEDAEEIKEGDLVDFYPFYSQGGIF